MDSIFEGRRETRYPFFKPVEITWTGATGDQDHAVGRSINVSLYGVLVEISESIPLFTEVSVSLQGTQLRSKARVRHCQKASFSFRVGLRFDRTLLAEHMPVFDTVLIHSLRCAKVNADPTKVADPKSWRQTLHGAVRAMLLQPSQFGVFWSSLMDGMRRAFSRTAADGVI